MQSNIINIAPDDIDPAEHKRECILTLISARRTARRAINEIDTAAETNRALRRLAKQHCASGNPLLVRNAQVIETRIAEQRRTIDIWHEVLLHVGIGIRAFSDDIDRLIPTTELFDILEVNPADRGKVSATAHLWEIVFVHGLEDSATHRGSDWKEGPLFQALAAYMDHMMKTNPAFQQQITDGLFGKGGMFEFVPTYSRTASGEFKRNPPKLRLADEKDLPANSASA